MKPCKECMDVLHSIFYNVGHFLNLQGFFFFLRLYLRNLERIWHWAWSGGVPFTTDFIALCHIQAFMFQRLHVNARLFLLFSVWAEEKLKDQPKLVKHAHVIMIPCVPSRRTGFKSLLKQMVIHFNGYFFCHVLRGCVRIWSFRDFSALLFPS